MIRRFFMVLVTAALWYVALITLIALRAQCTYPEYCDYMQTGTVAAILVLMFQGAVKK